MKSLGLLAVLAVVPATLALGGQADTDSVPTFRLADLADGSWVFVPDREGIRERIAFSHGPLREEAYAPAGDTVDCAVEVSDHARRVTVGPATPEGARLAFFRSESDSTRLEFQLREWAGGRFIVWAVGDSLQAELTIYGSGVPVVESRRGSLFRGR